MLLSYPAKIYLIYARKLMLSERTKFSFCKKQAEAGPILALFHRQQSYKQISKGQRHMLLME